MDINELETMLHNALKSDMATLTNRDTQIAIENILVALDNIQGLIHGLNADQVMDNYRNMMINKTNEFANFFVYCSTQRVMERGVQIYNPQPMMQPYMPMPQYQPMPQYMPQQTYQQPYMQPQYQPYPQEQYQQPAYDQQYQQQSYEQQSYSQPQQTYAPEPQQAPEPAVVKKSSLDEPLVDHSNDKEDDNSVDDGFALPGMGNDKPAPGRDYLLSLLKK